MRALVQRVTSASVTVAGVPCGAIDRGMLIFLGVAPSDTPEICDAMARKVAALRIFDDEQGRMNQSLADVHGAILCVSQFTLYGDLRRGNRPSFTGAAAGDVAASLYNRFCEQLRHRGVRCEEGQFGADMQVALVNDGPVTLWLDSDELQRPRRT